MVRINKLILRELSSESFSLTILRTQPKFQRMSTNKPPIGYVAITTGTVQDGDLMYDEVDGWEHAEGLEIGAPVAAFKGVARKSELVN